MWRREHLGRRGRNAGNVPWADLRKVRGRAREAVRRGRKGLAWLGKWLLIFTP